MSTSTDVGLPQFSGSGPSDNKRISLPPPPPRLSPDFRNGDFLSRLLAATPPYLYNIPLVPQSFFFSDMLKSFVAGTKNNSQQHQDQPPPPAPPPPIEFPNNPESAPIKELPGRPPHRRRKRTWRDVTEPPRFMLDRKLSQPIPPAPPPPPPPMDKPLELTNNNRSAPVEEISNGGSNVKIARHDSTSRMMSSPPTVGSSSPTNSVEASSPPTLPPPSSLLLPGLASHCGMLPLPGTDLHTRLPPNSSDHISSDLVPALPPFPPHLWYPSLYPGLGPGNLPPQTPYGIDPLHFFIDLRVSGHIWDRKPPFGTAGVVSPTVLDCTVDKHQQQQQPPPQALRGERGGSTSPHAEVTSSRLIELDSKSPVTMANACCDENLAAGNTAPLNLVTPPSSSININNKPPFNLLLGNGSHHAKHTSAFSVPEPRPIMMTTKRTKVHELENKNIISANYVLQNLPRIYNELQKCKDSPEERTIKVEAPSSEGTSSDGEQQDGKKDGEECKDLPALIGLELVVDYVKHVENKPGAGQANKTVTAAAAAGRAAATTDTVSAQATGERSATPPSSTGDAVPPRPLVHSPPLVNAAMELVDRSAVAAIPMATTTTPTTPP